MGIELKKFVKENLEIIFQSVIVFIERKEAVNEKLFMASVM